MAVTMSATKAFAIDGIGPRFEGLELDATALLVASSSSFSVMRLHNRPTMSSRVERRMPSRFAASLRSMSYCHQWTNATAAGSR